MRKLLYVVLLLPLLLASCSPTETTQIGACWISTGDPWLCNCAEVVDGVNSTCVGAALPEDFAREHPYYVDGSTWQIPVREKWYVHGGWQGVESHAWRRVGFDDWDEDTFWHHLGTWVFLIDIGDDLRFCGESGTCVSYEVGSTYLVQSSDQRRVNAVVAAHPEEGVLFTCWELTEQPDYVRAFRLLRVDESPVQWGGF